MGNGPPRGCGSAVLLGVGGGHGVRCKIRASGLVGGVLEYAATGKAGGGAGVAYIPILIFIVVAAMLPIVGLGVGRLLRPNRPGGDKLLPYECGVDPIGDARERFSVRFYIIAILFVIFDVETIFLFPWAIIYDQLALFGFIEMLIFLGILIVGYFYVWKKGALEWV